MFKVVFYRDARGNEPVKDAISEMVRGNGKTPA